MPLTTTAPSTASSTSNGTSNGVSQRDHFAAMAMQGILSHGLAVVGDRAMSKAEKNALLARDAFAIADAMVVESNKAN